MERLAIIDHCSHRIIIDDVSDSILEGYKGNEEEYIKDTYIFEEPDNFSWDYIKGAEYYTSEDGDPIEIDFDIIANL